MCSHFPACYGLLGGGGSSNSTFLPTTSRAVERSHSRKMPIGIANSGNLCFIISLIQLIANQEHLRSVLVSAWGGLFEVYDGTEGVMPSFCLDEILSHLKMDDGRQHDVNEALRQLMHDKEGLKSFMFSMVKEGVARDLTASLDACDVMFETSQIVEQEWILEVPLLKKINTIRDLFLAWSEDGGYGEVFNRGSERHEVDSSFRKLTSTSDNLFISLKRFAWSDQRQVKVTDSVSMPRFFKIPSEFIEVNSKREYHLSGFIVHLGENASNGHYIVYIKNGEHWYCCNDSRVVEAGRSIDGAIKQGYLYYYRSSSSDDGFELI